MKLTGKLKDKVESVESKEEKKAIIAEAGMELTDEELDGVAGGAIPFPKRPGDGMLPIKPTGK
ncbi:MAG: Nif11-like leader peptide family natural product precursor [Lachnospiraceae bacterium]|nr:Nif11-like leader peptide family natural product precursor [Lachnospiraceae bacterium]